MNMFRKKGTNPQEVIRHTNLKRNISKEFSKVLKVLQQRHLNADDPIYSDDEANTLCNILEAVFLHGLKDSMASKLVNYVGFGTQTSDSTVTMNFWSFVVKFTHKDVIEQLKGLPQISSEIGLCRAWVRLALNDGLMESYLHSVTGDGKTLQYFYHSTAYLRDHEQPGILKSYLSGLMTLTFQLSFNSSVLNDWTSSPLVLSGIVDSQTPTPIFNVKPRTERNVSPEIKPTIHSPSKITRTKHGRSDGADILDNSHDGLHPPPNTPYNMPGFTRADVEAIKKLSFASSPHTASECSTSSHISCPDPSNGAAPSFDTTVIENQILQEIMAQNEADLQKARDGKGLKVSPVINRKTPQHSPKVKHKSKTSDNSLHSLEHKENRASPIDLMREHEKSPKFKRKEEENVIVSDVKHTSVLIETECQCQPINKISKTHHEDICDTQDSNTDLPEQKTESIDSVLDSSILPNDSEKTKESVICKEHEKLPPLDRCVKELSPFAHFTPTSCSNKCKCEPAEPELSQAIADKIETAPISDVESSLCVVRERITNTDTISTPISSELSEIENGSNESPKSIGNKLSAMSGWSSEFENSGEYLSEKNLAKFDSSTEEAYNRRPKAESFGTLLQNYAPKNSRGPGPSLDQVIQNLPSSSTSDVDSVDASDVPRRIMKTQQSEDPVDEEYEIVESQMSKFDSSSSPNTRLNHYKELCTEKGLDSQNYQCKGCTRPVGIIYGSPRVCSFDGGYYCFECHENDECCIPASIVYNWDFRKFKVAKENLEFMQQMEEQPILDLEELNPKIYEHVPELEEVRILRQQLCSLKTYLFTCQQTVAVELRKKVWPREHLYDSRHIYSVGDLQQVASGQLGRFLKDVVKFACKHVYDCSLCSQKGFICEVCNNAKVIYPFEVDSTYRCSCCKAVYHKTCMTENLPCPKCTRWRLRKDSFGADSEDYAFTPP